MLYGSEHEPDMIVCSEIDSTVTIDTIPVLNQGKKPIIEVKKCELFDYNQ